jgi:drug/metabolite transporter (DMT)-like permease
MKYKLPVSKLGKRNSTHINLLLPYLALLLTAVIWGGALPIIKLTTQYIPPFTFLFLRFVVVCVVMLPVVFIQLKKTAVDPRDIKNLILLGIAGQTSLALIFWGVKYTTSLDAAIISTIAPLMTIAAAHYFFKDPLNNAVKIGIAIAAMGMLFIVLEPVLSANGTMYEFSANQRIFGNILVVLYNFAFMMYIIWSKAIMGNRSASLTSFFRHFHVSPMRKSYSPLFHTTFGFYVGLVTILPFALAENAGAFGTEPLNIANLTATPILGILYMALLSSIVAYLAFEWGIHKAHASDGAIFGYLGPLFTLPVAYLLLGETPSKVVLIGASVIAVGVIIAESKKPIAHPR